MPFSRISLSSDCSKCAALCCMALAFDQESGCFSYDKPAGIACHHLCHKTHLCQIHSDLERQGFSGCTLYECNGAGQYVTQKIFQGRSWLTNPEILDQMMRAFQKMRQICDMLVLLETALRMLPLTKRNSDIIISYQHALMPSEGWTQEKLDSFDFYSYKLEILTFLSGFKQGFRKR